MQIQQEEKITTHVKNTISSRALAIKQKQRQQKEQWLACQHYCQEQMPSIVQPDVFASAADMPAVEQLECNDAELKALSDAITQVLVQRIDHVS